jgi:hypothetical protein
MNTSKIKIPKETPTINKIKSPKVFQTAPIQAIVVEDSADPQVKPKSMREKIRGAETRQEFFSDSSASAVCQVSNRPVG